jgi:type IV pilus assembly protein PilA
MKFRGFTLIELLIVILIVAILAAVAVPLLTAQIEKAKWSEGQAGVGTIATALKAYVAEYGQAPPGNALWLDPPAGLGLSEGDFNGKYFESENYSYGAVTYDPSADPSMTYTVTVDSSGVAGEWKYASVSLEVTGVTEEWVWVQN